MGTDAETDKAVAAEIPSWIDPRLFVDALKDVELQFKDIEDFKLKHALAPGENYASIMLNADIVIRLKGE